MTDFGSPWLLATVALPLCGAAVLSRLRDPDRARRWCLAIATATLALASGAWIAFSLGEETALHALPLSLDQLSAPLLPLAALLYLLTAVATLRTKVRRFSFVWMLLSEAIVLATLSCRVPWGVIALLAAGTVPPYFELRARRKPTQVYVVHMAAFVALLALGWQLLAARGGGLAPAWAAVPLVLALFIRCGIAPLHCWAADLFEHATFGTALLFVTPMLGEYGMMRLLVPIAPSEVLHAVALAALLTAVYAAGMALVQREARRFFCYLYLSHSAMVLVGLDINSPIGLTGGLCVWLSVGLALAGLGLVLRSLEARHGRLSLAAYHGAYAYTPALAVCFLLTGMASVGFPGTFGFLGMEMLVDGAVQAIPYIGIGVVIAAALNGIAVLKVYFLLFTGKRYVESVPLAIGRRERVAVLTFAALILGGGILPQPGVHSRHEAALAILREREGLAAQRSLARPPQLLAERPPEPATQHRTPLND